MESAFMYSREEVQAVLRKIYDSYHSKELSSEDYGKE